jgi:hypothetical protein
VCDASALAKFSACPPLNHRIQQCRQHRKRRIRFYFCDVACNEFHIVNPPAMVLETTCSQQFKCDPLDVLLTTPTLDCLIYCQKWCYMWQPSKTLLHAGDVACNVASCGCTFTATVLQYRHSIVTLNWLAIVFIHLIQSQHEKNYGSHVGATAVARRAKVKPLVYIQYVLIIRLWT